MPEGLRRLEAHSPCHYYLWFKTSTAVRCSNIVVYLMGLDKFILNVSLVSALYSGLGEFCDASCPVLRSVSIYQFEVIILLHVKLRSLR